MSRLAIVGMTMSCPTVCKDGNPSCLRTEQGLGPLIQGDQTRKLNGLRFLLADAAAEESRIEAIMSSVHASFRGDGGWH